MTCRKEARAADEGDIPAPTIGSLGGARTLRHIVLVAILLFGASEAVFAEDPARCRDVARNYETNKPELTAIEISSTLFAAVPILLLTTTGARTGRPTTVPLGFAVDGSGRVFVMASKAGAPRHPAWFHNLRANPSVTVERRKVFSGPGSRDGGRGARPALRHGF